jgi:hypothetical protein
MSGGGEQMIFHANQTLENVFYIIFQASTKQLKNIFPQKTFYIETNTTYLKANRTLAL